MKRTKGKLIQPSNEIQSIDEIMQGKEIGTVKILSINSGKGIPFIPLLRAELGNGRLYYLVYLHGKENRSYCRWRSATTQLYRFAGICEKLPPEHLAAQQANAIQIMINEGGITRAINDSKMNIYSNSLKHWKTPEERNQFLMVR